MIEQELGIDNDIGELRKLRNGGKGPISKMLVISFKDTLKKGKGT